MSHCACPHPHSLLFLSHTQLVPVPGPSCMLHPLPGHLFSLSVNGRPLDLLALVLIDSPTSATQVPETTGVCHYTRLIFKNFSVEKWFHHVAQAGL
ncbi:hypothetical protein AAY473_022826 [Plecturocebus cupreus]